MFPQALTAVILSLLSPGALLLSDVPSRAAEPAPAATGNATVTKPSFDCTTAKSKVKLLICGNDDLAALDRQEDQLLRRARAKAVQPDAVNSEQDFWISQRDACASVACLSRAYRQRIQELHAWTN
jgi:uncharacterized protein